MAKPKKLYRVETANGPGRYLPGASPKRTFARLDYAEALAKRIRHYGGTATIFVTECDWRPLDPQSTP